MSLNTGRSWAACLLAVCLCGVMTVNAVELRSFNSAADKARFDELSNVLRCLVCQNQSLADSDADLAQDLRRQVHEMIDAGKSNDEITDYMVARYGNFVLYKPPFNAATMALWVTPFALAGVGLALLFVMLKRRRARGDVKTDDLSAQEREKLGALLNSDGGNPQ